MLRLKNMPDQSHLSPALAAMMCDGMGWFSPLDYKRMLLAYDRIYYLLPSTTVEFEDVGGARQSFYSSTHFKQNPLFEIWHDVPEATVRDLIFAAARLDAESERFRAAVDAIPLEDRLYTWRITNADADLGGGVSPALRPDEQALAHAVLLNKFLLAADHLNCAPITGKPYIHTLIRDKFERAGTAADPLQKRGVKLGPVTARLVGAIVPDDELAKRTEQDIVEYKNRNRKLFEQFSYTVQSMVKQINSLPASANFDRDVQQLLNTEVWRDQVSVENELRLAWESFFKAAVKAAVGSAVVVGITPLLSLGHLTFASVLTGAAAAAPWAISEALRFQENRQKVRQHGLYYLLRFR
ncbi:MAG TPA: hypothetical protein VHW24_00185 [Bryobacteraceae bacterium]|nr:hypothetical protein [Bryobacteraceae bacterium]